MNNIIVYIETENGKISDVSLELMTKARSLSKELSCDLEALLIGSNVKELQTELFTYGAKIIHVADDVRLENYRTLPYSAITISLFKVSDVVNSFAHCQDCATIKNI